MNDRIEKQIEIKAPVSRVWRALTDSREFGQWFQAKIEGPFVAGKMVKGQNAYPGYEHLKFELSIQKIEPETYFSYKWHPYPADPKIDYSKEELTLVEFRLEPTKTGCILTVTESGFDKIPAGRRPEAFRMHEGGWSEQMGNIAKYVTQKSA